MIPLPPGGAQPAPAWPECRSPFHPARKGLCARESASVLETFPLERDPASIHTFCAGADWSDAAALGRQAFPSMNSLAFAFS
jgi:hypothetical protein